MIKTVAFIGVGNMGFGMASNILKSGFKLHIIAHRNRKPVDDLVELGAKEFSDIASLVKDVDAVVLCVTGSSEVEEIIRGDHGIIARAKQGCIVIDTSTSDPVSTRALALELEAAKMELVDCPLGRTPKEALSGSLDSMVGCSEETLAIIHPLVSAWSGNIVHIGELGSAHTVKLINNFIALGYGALYAEALALARKAGLSIKQVDDVISTSRLTNGFYETFMKYSLMGDRDAHRFSIKNAHKDMRYVASLANHIGAVTPIQAQVKNAYAAMENTGGGDDYVPMLADYIAKVNGLSEDGMD